MFSFDSSIQLLAIFSTFAVWLNFRQGQNHQHQHNQDELNHGTGEHIHGHITHQDHNSIVQNTGDDYGYVELHPDRPYQGTTQPITHSYSPPSGDPFPFPDPSFGFGNNHGWNPNRPTPPPPQQKPPPRPLQMMMILPPKPTQKPGYFFMTSIASKLRATNPPSPPPNPQQMLVAYRPYSTLPSGMTTPPRSTPPPHHHHHPMMMMMYSTVPPPSSQIPITSSYGYSNTPYQPSTTHHHHHDHQPMQMFSTIPPPPRTSQPPPPPPHHHHHHHHEMTSYSTIPPPRTTQLPPQNYYSHPKQNQPNKEQPCMLCYNRFNSQPPPTRGSSFKFSFRKPSQAPNTSYHPHVPHLTKITLSYKGYMPPPPAPSTSDTKKRPSGYAPNSYDGTGLIAQEFSRPPVKEQKWHQQPPSEQNNFGGAYDTGSNHWNN